MLENGKSKSKEFFEKADIGGGLRAELCGNLHAGLRAELCGSSPENLCGGLSEGSSGGLRADSLGGLRGSLRGDLPKDSLSCLNASLPSEEEETSDLPKYFPEQEHDQFFMNKALEQARLAGDMDEVPIGAVVVYEGRIIAQAGNRREIDADPAGHAEFIALKKAAEILGVWRLSGAVVYVTLEPCIMCAGLMHQARIDRCVFGAFDPKAGALGSLYNIHCDERLNHQFQVTPGVCKEEASALLKSFFSKKRRAKKEQKAQKNNSVE